MNYHFTLIYRLPDPETSGEDIIERLGSLGYTDVLVGVGREGIVALEYSRRGHDAEEVVTQAISEISEILPNAILVESTAVTFSQ